MQARPQSAPLLSAQLPEVQQGESVVGGEEILLGAGIAVSARAGAGKSTVHATSVGTDARSSPDPESGGGESAGGEATSFVRAELMSPTELFLLRVVPGMWGD